MNSAQLTLAQGFKSPDSNRFTRDHYEKYIEEKLPPEVPQMFGLHPNAEIGYLTLTADTLFGDILTIQGGGGGGGGQKEDGAKALMEQILEELPENFNFVEITSKTQERTPYIVVLLQEVERMNLLLSEIRKSLVELDQGMKGQLNVTDAMETISFNLSINKVPDTWTAIAYASLKSLGAWFEDLKRRVQQINEWQDTMEVPLALWISGLFNPMSFLTAIMQVTSREHSYPLDSMCLQTDVTNTMDPTEITARPADGMYIYGYFLEGAGWEIGRGNEQGYLTEMVLKELHPVLPVVNVVAKLVKDRDLTGFYECPVYVTSMRGGTLYSLPG